MVFRRCAFLAGISAFALMLPVAAQGQTGGGTKAENSGLSDIVVTARRTQESLQSVPVAVTALSGEFLDRQNFRDAANLTLLTPNLTIAAQPASLSAAAVYIRGIGNNEPAALSEQGVGVYLDGVYIARAAGALFDLVDLERTEVLRGPQGTTFGRNTIGGAVQLISKKPSDDFHLNAKAGYGRFNDWFVRSRIDTGYIGGSNIKASFAAQHREANGYVNNLLTPPNQDPGSVNGDAFIATVRGDFGALTVDYNFDYNDRRGSSPFFQLLAARPDVISYFSQSPSFGGDPFLVSPDRQQDIRVTGFLGIDGVYRYTSRTRVYGHSLTVSYEALPYLTLKSITGYRGFYQYNTQGFGEGNLMGRVVQFNPATNAFGLAILPVTNYGGSNAPQKQHQFSQEFQALGSSGDFTYLGGIYYFHEKASEYNRQALTLVTSIDGLANFGFPASASTDILAANPGLIGSSLVGINATPLQAFSGTTESMAAFGQLSWRPSALDDKLELTVGGRYTTDKKTAILAGDVIPSQRGRISFENASWLASAAYHFNDSALLYGRVSTGYRTGGIAPRATIINTYQPEKALAYEVGLKSELFDRRVRINVSGYLTKYDDLQVTQFAANSGGALSLIVNAGKAEIKGFEAEVAVTPVSGLVFDGSLGYIDVKYKKFLFRDPTTNQLVDVAAVARPTYTPKWSVHAGGEYSQDIGPGTARLRVDYSYRSTIFFNTLDLTTPLNHEIRSRPDHNLKARLSLEDVAVGNSRMTFGVWGDNLTNQKNSVYGIDFGALGFAGSTFKKPVSYGVDAEVKF